MSMATGSEFRQRLVAGALRSVKAARNARLLFDQADNGHRAKTEENDRVTREYLEDTIRTAMGYGYPVEAVADAADMTTDEVTAIVEDAAA